MCFFHTAATMHLIRVAEHLGVRLPASPTPRPSTTNPPGTRRLDGRSPKNAVKIRRKKHQLQSFRVESVPTSPYLPTSPHLHTNTAMNTRAANHVERRQNPCPYRRICTPTRTSHGSEHTSTIPRRAKRKPCPHSSIRSPTRASCHHKGRDGNALGTEHEHHTTESESATLPTATYLHSDARCPHRWGHRRQ